MNKAALFCVPIRKCFCCSRSNFKRWCVFEGAKHDGYLHCCSSERSVSFACNIPLRTSFFLFAVHPRYNKAFVHFLQRVEQWHLNTLRQESGQSAVWLEVEMARLFQTKAQWQKKSFCVHSWVHMSLGYGLRRAASVYDFFDNILKTMLSQT